eukprot:5221138-Amphidinium_carterae.1
MGPTEQNLDRQVQGDRRPRAGTSNHSMQETPPLCWHSHHGHQNHAQMVATAGALESNIGPPYLGGIVLA